MIIIQTQTFLEIYDHPETTNLVEVVHIVYHKRYACQPDLARGYRYNLLQGYLEPHRIGHRVGTCDDGWYIEIL